MIWYVALGSAIGGMTRYLLGGWIQTRAGTTFPIQTLLINLTGSFLLGFLQTYALETAAISPNIRAMLTVGFCGGYTTFSTFSFETVRLLEDGDWGRAGLYMGLSLVLCIAGAIAGVMLAREFIALKHR